MTLKGVRIFFWVEVVRLNINPSGNVKWNTITSAQFPLRRPALQGLGFRSGERAGGGGGTG
jgi:hypothetical protein